jgi:choline-sulfatase
MRPTNLLVIMADQHNPRFMGGAGHPVVKTPNLDSLAARGTRFVNAYTNSPICVPARASMATGRYPHQLECWDNATPYVGQAPSWGHRLTAQGHRVTTIGKLHFRNPSDDTGFPDQRIPLHVHEEAGDYFGLLREEMPPRPQQRKYVVEAGAGDSEYLRYDRAIAEQTRRWLRDEAHGHAKPWALFVSLVCPHPPLVAPPEYLALYPPESVVLPVNWRHEDWPHHPAIDLKRRLQVLDDPLDEATLRNAIAAYYALCTFMDDQVGIVLRTLEEEGFVEDTRILYTSDHGDSVGEHGLWYKNTMYEGSVTVPMIVAGPDVPSGKLSETNVSLVDVFPTAVEAVGARPEPEDADLPAASLWELAGEEGRRSRTVFSEYHASQSPSGTFMVRGDRYKYVHYVGYPPQLFDLEADPDETRDLGRDPGYAAVRQACERELRAICDPEAVDARARADQRRRVEAVGGKEAIVGGGVKFTHSPPPTEFQDAPGVWRP